MARSTVVRVARSALVQLFALMILLVPALAHAAGPVSLPALDGVTSPLQIEIVGYNGSTNGEMLVRVKNPTAKSATFAARGLYFVPDGDPEKAPQRLGAAGPFSVTRNDKVEQVEKLEIPAGATSEVSLQVFCIDSHRPSPTPATPFSLAKTRLPKQLHTQIEAQTRVALRKSGGKMPAAKPAIQQEVWAARNKAWVKLDGERANEKSAEPPHRQERRPSPAPKQPALH
jgi:hypothetical protein